MPASRLVSRARGSHRMTYRVIAEILPWHHHLNHDAFIITRPGYRSTVGLKPHPGAIHLCHLSLPPGGGSRRDHTARGSHLGTLIGRTGGSISAN